ncbi:hypothetical protein [Streptomyces sp. NPDC058045]|uniref:hypothetical protein n=1 Tax=Streptomyces sp. NPDC058045 TaxID=3346311 RepID=UPI0036E07CA4
MPTPPESTDVRSAAVVNEEIRALWRRAAGRLTTEQRRRYERLITEWSAAVARESATPRPARTPPQPRDPRTPRGACPECQAAGGPPDRT